MRPHSVVLWGSAVVFVAGALLVVDTGGRRGEETFARGSVFDETPQGLSLAFRYLRERARAEGTRTAVSVLSRPLAGGAWPADGVVFRVRPRRLPLVAGPPEEAASEDDSPRREPRRVSRPLLTRQEEAWVRGGGRLILGLDQDYGPLAVAPVGQAGPVRKTFPLWPEVRALEPGGPVYGVSRGLSEQLHTVFSRGRVALLSRLVVGRGEVWVLTAPGLLENGRLAMADHLGLLEALAGSGRPILFDEWVHGLGQDESLLALMLEWGLGPALVAAALAFVLLLWRHRKRLGPEEAAVAEERSEAVDLVDSLAQLYDRALSRREAAALHLQGFRKAVSLRTGLRGAALEQRTRTLLDDAALLPAGERELPASGFLRILHAVNDGYRRLDEHAHTRRRS